jgi:cytochrome c oxidase assembly protein subunit 15
MDQIVMAPIPSISNNRPIILWLLSTCFLIWLMIILGGATRLTHSGLSIVEWKPITGIIPPLNQTQWIEEFEKYQQFPEYKLVNKGMSLSSFQFIYLMEYAHRLLGRLMGLWFIIPLIYFWSTSRLSFLLKRRAIFALGLGMLQGFIGWYMVKSGLVKDPTVSHYRLTIHLSLAIALYGLLFWTALEIMVTPKKEVIKPEPKIIGILSLLCCLALSKTILYGGFVAGLKAGLIYNTFPLMGGHFLPDEWAFYHPLWLNFLENAALIQWLHRWIAVSTIILILYTTWRTIILSPNRLTRQVSGAFACIALLQGALGILTLLYQVPVTLGTLHQGMAILLFTLGLSLYFLGKPQKKFSNFDLGREGELV